MPFSKTDVTALGALCFGAGMLVQTGIDIYYNAMRREPVRLVTGRLAMWPSEDRVRFGRCVLCEWHPDTQGHDAACPMAGQV
jgi:hypothetical protein